MVQKQSCTKSYGIKDVNLLQTGTFVRSPIHDLSHYENDECRKDLRECFRVNISCMNED